MADPLLDLAAVERLLNARIDSVNMRITAVDKYFTDSLNDRLTSTKDTAAQGLQGLRERTELALAGARETIGTAMRASEMAITKAETALNQRLAAGNEIKAAMEAQQSTFAKKDQVDVQFEAMKNRIDALEELRALATGKSSGVGMTTEVISRTFSFIATLIAIGTALFVLKH